MFMNSPYTILVNSTDCFEDCWQPFFTLLDKYWAGTKPSIILNSETKDFTYGGLDITCSKVAGAKTTSHLAWGECLLRCLEKINTEIVLYLQEDYFINAPVDVEQINAFVKIMREEQYSHISLVTFSNGGPWCATKYPLLWEVGRNASYRISLQAGLWRKDRLRFYLRRHETPWQFEVWGSKRAHRIKDTFLCVSRDVFDNHSRQIIPYEPTGIVKGKWNRDVVYRLFLENGIDVDYSKRGFYDPQQEDGVKRPLAARAMSRLRSLF
jgi:hypothetical protein